MFSAFPWVAAHLDLHSSRILACSSLRENEQGEFLLQGVETLGQHAGAGDPGRDPEVSDQHQRVAEADPSRLELRAFGDTLHFEPDEIVADGQSPEFLDDFLGRSAAGLQNPYSDVRIRPSPPAIIAVYTGPWAYPGSCSCLLYA